MLIVKQMILFFIQVVVVSLAFENAQRAFNIIQQNLYDLKLILNSVKTKCMVFSNARHVTNHVIATLAGHTIEQVGVQLFGCVG